MTTPDDRRDGELPDREIDARFDELARSLGPLEVPHTGPRDYSPEEDEEGFVEPDPDLGPANPMVTLGWFGLLGGIALVVAAVLANLSGTVGVIGALMAAAGLGALVLQLPKGGSERDDDGAQV